MNRRIEMVLGGLMLIASTSFADEPARRMAVTFDDLPTVAVAGDTLQADQALTDKLLNTLLEKDIPVIGFVNEHRLYDLDGKHSEEQVALLRQWLDAGFELGNHGFSHLDLHRVSLDEFIADVERGDQVTRQLLGKSGQQPRYFRHPYLHTGLDLDTKREFEDFLSLMSYQVAPVSIDNSEWIFARAYAETLQDGNAELAAQIGQDYVDYMMEMVRYYEGQSEAIVGRNIAHVLLVHANSLNADWFGSLADQIAEAGYDFISLDEALKDPAYASADTYTGPGGITWLHRWAITRGMNSTVYAGEPRTPDYVKDIVRVPEHLY